MHIAINNFHPLDSMQGTSFTIEQDEGAGV
jgi:hypothetical protein